MSGISGGRQEGMDQTGLEVGTVSHQISESIRVAYMRILSTQVSCLQILNLNGTKSRSSKQTPDSSWSCEPRLGDFFPPLADSPLLCT